MNFLHGLGRKGQIVQDLRVGVRVLQRLPLKLDGGQRAVDLSELLLVPLLPFQSLQGR